VLVLVLVIVLDPHGWSKTQPAENPTFAVQSYFEVFRPAPVGNRQRARLKRATSVGTCPGPVAQTFACKGINWYRSVAHFFWGESLLRTFAQTTQNQFAKSMRIFALVQETGRDALLWSLDIPDFQNVNPWPEAANKA
jgi:hypothetical protein